MDRYVIRCLDCLMFGTPIPPDTTCGNCSSHATEKWVAPEVVESLRSELASLKDKHHGTVLNYIDADRERVELRRELKAWHDNLGGILERGGQKYGLSDDPVQARQMILEFFGRLHVEVELLKEALEKARTALTEERQKTIDLLFNERRPR